MSEGREQKGLLGTDELCCSGLHTVEACKRGGASARPNRAAVLHARSDVGLVDGGELGTSEDGASTVQERDGPGGAFRNVQDVEVPGQFVCM